MTTDTQLVTFRLDRQDYTAFSSTCERHGYTMSKILRRLVQDWTATAAEG